MIALNAEKYFTVERQRQSSFRLMQLKKYRTGLYLQKGFGARFTQKLLELNAAIATQGLEAMALIFLIEKIERLLCAAKQKRSTKVLVIGTAPAPVKVTRRRKTAWVLLLASPLF